MALRYVFVALCVAAVSIALEVEMLQDTDQAALCPEGHKGPCPKKAAASIQKAIDAGGKGETIADAKKLVKAFPVPAAPDAAAIEKVGEKAAQAKAKIEANAAEHAKEQVDELKTESKAAEESAQQDKEDADDIQKQKTSELNAAKTEAKVEEAKAEGEKKVEQEKLAKAKTEEQDAIDGANRKSMAAAKTSLAVASKGHEEAVKNVETAKEEVLAAAHAQSKINAALKGHKADMTHAKDPMAAPKPKSVSAAEWAAKAAAAKAEAFTAHLDSAKAAQKDLAAFRSLHRFEAKLNEAKSDVREAKSELTARQAVAEEGTTLANKADADAKYSVNRRSVKKQLTKAAAEMDKTEQNADIKLAAERQKVKAAQQGEAQMEHGGQQETLRKNADMAERKMNEGDILARNAQMAYDEVNSHFKLAAKEQKRKDQRAQVAAELRQKKAVTAQKLAEAQLTRKETLKKEAGEKVKKAEKANEKRTEARAELQLESEKAKKAEIKADNAKESKLKLAKKEVVEEQKQGQEKIQKKSKKAQEIVTKAKHQTNEVGSKSEEKSATGAQQEAIDQGAHGAAQAAKPQDACKACHNKCRSSTCKGWCDKRWCKDDIIPQATTQDAKPEAAAKDGQTELSQPKLMEAQDAIETAIESDSAGDIAKAKAALDGDDA